MRPLLGLDLHPPRPCNGLIYALPHPCAHCPHARIALTTYPISHLLARPSYNHCAVFDEENNRLIIFGGRTAERKRLNDIYFLDLDSFTWRARMIHAFYHHQSCITRRGHTTGSCAQTLT